MANTIFNTQADIKGKVVTGNGFAVVLGSVVALCAQAQIQYQQEINYPSELGTENRYVVIGPPVGNATISQMASDSAFFTVAKQAGKCGAISKLSFRGGSSQCGAVLSGSIHIGEAYLQQVQIQAQAGSQPIATSSVLSFVALSQA
jgi:hypothetical protein